MALHQLWPYDPLTSLEDQPSEITDKKFVKLDGPTGIPHTIPSPWEAEESVAWWRAQAMR